MLFAHLKRILKLDRLRLRGLTGATDEFTLAAAVQNYDDLPDLFPKDQRHELRRNLTSTSSAGRKRTQFAANYGEALDLIGWFLFRSTSDKSRIPRRNRVIQRNRPSAGNKRITVLSLGSRLADTMV